MKNPLIKRFPRELKAELGKWIVLFIFIAGMIGIVSGFLIGSESMVLTFNENFEKYNIEDGNFELAAQAEENLYDKFEEQGATLYENYYFEKETDDFDSTIRIFKNRTEVNKVCLMSGEIPVIENEIAIDRVYAKNNNIKVGDKLSIDGTELTVSGFVALTDYSTLYSSPSDMLFDSIKFGVGIVNDDGFENIDKDNHYSYSWTYNEKPADDMQAKEKSDKVLELLVENTIVTQFIPAYSNQAIHFAGDDMGTDTVMLEYFLYLMMAVIAFVFAITTSNTIVKEANVIGTLRASGYTRTELIIHYLTMPIIVTFVAAVVGNILGYTVFKDFATNLMYNSYSLTTYIPRRNAAAFIKTTAIPVCIIILINFLILWKKLRLSPLKFIRRDLSQKGKKKAIRLNAKIGILTRFRIRVIFQNIPNYVMIFIGIFLANVILIFGCGLNPLLEHNQDTIIDNIIADYQYVLKTPVETNCEGAEKYCTDSLKTTDENFISEDVTIYGVSDNSKYVDVDDGVYISSAFAAKHKLVSADKTTLRDTYENKDYTFEIDGVYDYPAGLAVFMDIHEFNEIFGNEPDYYSGYFSNTEIDDIEDFVAVKITADDYTKTSRQLMVSFEGLSGLLAGFGIIVFMLIIYLLSKIIIEKNGQSISMTKILGYSNSEINSLYIASTAIVVVLSMLVTMPLTDIAMTYILPAAMASYSGYFFYYMPTKVFIAAFTIGILGYAVIAFAQTRKVKKIPLDIALKNVE